MSFNCCMNFYWIPDTKGVIEYVQIDNNFRKGRNVNKFSFSLMYMVSIVFLAFILLRQKVIGKCHYVILVYVYDQAYYVA